MGVTALKRIAVEAAPGVFVVSGTNTARVVHALYLESRLRISTSPRHANILLITGDVGERVEALCRLHDQLPHPRATVWWNRSALAGWPSDLVTDDDHLVDVLVCAWSELMIGKRSTECDRLPNEPLVAWRGVGPYGQGGEGMMGGTPYGRAMAMTGKDLRDGLALDVYTARVGPFLSSLPGGLQLELTLQGDVIQTVQVLKPPLSQPELTREPLLQAASLLRLLELPALAERCTRAAIYQRPAPRLLLYASGVLRAIPTKLCRLSDGGDAHTRLEQWIRHANDQAPLQSDDECSCADAGLVEGVSLQSLLAGLEWHEAILGINSLPRELLILLCHQALQDPDNLQDNRQHRHQGHGA